MRVCGILSLLFALWCATSCGQRLVRLEAQGRHEEVIARASQARWRPRHAAARAYAAALHATGQSEHARDVLLEDYRRGGDLRSLVALADLELGLGRDGIAAVHYTRAATLQRRVLAGRKQVCDLFERRALAFVELGEGEAALDDLQRVQELCRRAPTRATIERARRVARVQVDARVDATRCKTTACVSARAAERVAAVEGALAHARSPAELRRVAARLRASLPPARVIELVLADARGRAGDALVDDDELRSWIGESVPESFRDPLGALPAAEGAYVRLRLDRVLAASPDGGPVGATQRLLWLDRALVIADVVPSRVLAYAGDLAGVELGLASAWRPATVDRAPGAATGLKIGEHWAGRIAPTTGNLSALLLVARLRGAAGEQDLELQLARTIATRADAAKVPGTHVVIGREAARALAWGRPWSALAIADAIPRAELDSVRAAAATGILLSAAVCGGPCPDDDDRAVVERVLGSEWMTAIEPRLRELALARARTLARADGCPTLAELFAPDAGGPLARTLAELHERPDAPGVDAALVAAIEADPALACSGRIAVPLLAARAPVLGAARLAEMLAHAPEIRASDVLGLHAALALVAGEQERAEMLAIAAGGEASDPGRSWREIAEVARATDVRDVEMQALRELVLVRADFDEPVARRELVAHAVRDVVRSWGAGKTPAGREASRRNVDDWVDEAALAQRWGRRERLAATIAERSWFKDPHEEEFAELILPTGPVRDAHRVALARLGLAERVIDEASWSPSALAWIVTHRKIAAPPIVAQLFGDPERNEEARLAFAKHGRDWGVRRRIAVGLAAYGSRSARVRAAEALREMTADVPAARRELELLLLDAPAAIEPVANVEDPPRAVGLVDDRHALSRVVFGLPLEPALFLIDDEMDGGAPP